jgi:hypothetical protein
MERIEGWEWVPGKVERVSHPRKRTRRTDDDAATVQPQAQIDVAAVSEPIGRLDLPEMPFTDDLFDMDGQPLPKLIRLDI